ncbi:hypothetical protein MPSEU_000828100 [Mayamaea pseudoterrestris]|nr:hypothetical protein MPSEU_000828100 [Mayamaea pseudoterrestris]
MRLVPYSLLQRSKASFRSARREMSDDAMVDASSDYRNSSSSSSSSMIMTEPIHILGAGSIGLLLAASIRLAYPSYPVQLLVRDRQLYRSILENSKTVTVCLRGAAESNNTSKDATMRHRRPQPRLVDVPAQIIEPQSPSALQRPLRNLIVATKAWQAVDAVASVRHRLNSSSKVIILCNGSLAVKEELQQAMREWSHDDTAASASAPFAGNQQLHLAWTSHGAYREEHEPTDPDDYIFHVVHAGHGQLVLEDNLGLANLLHQTGLNATSVSFATIVSQLWGKLAANCVINPFTALHKCRNGELLEMKNRGEHGIDRTMRKLISEIAQVAQAAQVNGSGLSSAELEDFCLQVMRDTANNKSSMLQDVLAGQPTEIDYMNGYIVQRGQALGIPCPANELLVKQVGELLQ